ncbi:MAG: DJ-1/PfpI family protein [Acidovorax sp.]|nr:DJ-1/PfpI family protein [Acidovorax sp.]
MRWLAAPTVLAAVSVSASVSVVPGGPVTATGPLTLPLRSSGAAPVIAVLALNEGTETTDFLVPHAVLRQAQVGVVEAVAPRAGRVVLMPALQVDVTRDFASFDAAYPAGADIVVVPALHTDDDPAVVAWLQRQAARGAVVVGVCAGARVLGQAGLLDGRSFTGHWYDRSTLLRRHPGASHVPDLRYLADGPVVTTTGVSASLPVSLAIVEALAGTDRARAVANELGLVSWRATHRSGQFGLGPAHLWTLTTNTVLFWRHERIEIPVVDGADDVALAFVADAWSRTYRSSARAVHAQAPGVRLRSGLLLRVVPPGALAVQAPMAQDLSAACVLSRSLQAIGQRYGDATRQWVATQLEYDELLEGCAPSEVLR